MFDAYLQADYIVHDRAVSQSLAADYFDFENVDRYKTFKKWMSHNNPWVDRLKESPNRPSGEPALIAAYEKVKGRFARPKRKTDSPDIKDSDLRNQWYAGDLRQIARQLGKLDEYDILLAAFHGCVHSSANALRHGPPLKAENLMMWASTIAARVMQLNLSYHHVQLSDTNQAIMAIYNRPYFGGLSADEHSPEPKA
jgi:hypothetical protein